MKKVRMSVGRKEEMWPRHRREERDHESCDLESE